ncbi:MAG: hypothetical protein OHK0039_25010 [Bacteroidia bacterium]
MLTILPPRGAGPTAAEIDLSSVERDLGYRDRGRLFTARLGYLNAGYSDLYIYSASCTCPFVEILPPDKPLAPGRHSELELRITPPEAGTFRCYLTLESNSREVVHVVVVRGIAR